MPTVLDLLGVDPPSSVQGRSLRRLLQGQGKSTGPAYSETFYPRYHYGWSELQALRREGIKFIAAPRPELYDLVHDPRESHNLGVQALSGPKDAARAGKNN